MDRSIQPQQQKLRDPKFKKAISKPLDNGLPYFEINAGSQEVLRVEIGFEAGTYHQSKSLVANLTNKLLSDGTQSKSAIEVAEAFDHLGAFLQTECDEDYAAIELYVLRKHLAKALPLLHEVITEAAFPEEEFGLKVKTSRDKFSVNSQKVNFLAKQAFGPLIFGSEHPYGKRAVLDSFDEIALDDVKAFFRENYQLSNAYVLVAGKVDDDVQPLLNQVFGQFSLSKTAVESSSYVAPKPSAEKCLFIPVEGALQSAIRIGRRFHNKLHPDFMKMQVLNTLLGGYFSSRLMSNIREDKGYTYGIGSALVSLKHDGYFFIGTEVGADVREDAEKEIHFELDRLRNELIPDEELDIVRNYLLGAFMRNMDGPFAQADRFVGAYRIGKGHEFYQEYLQVIRTVSAAELQVLAQRYLQPDDLYTVVVGK